MYCSRTVREVSALPIFGEDLGYPGTDPSNVDLLLARESCRFTGQLLTLVRGDAGECSRGREPASRRTRKLGEEEKRDSQRQTSAKLVIASGWGRWMSLGEGASELQRSRLGRERDGRRWATASRPCPLVHPARQYSPVAPAKHYYQTSIARREPISVRRGRNEEVREAYQAYKGSARTNRDPFRLSTLHLDGEERGGKATRARCRMIAWQRVGPSACMLA